MGSYVSALEMFDQIQGPTSWCTAQYKKYSLRTDTYHEYTNTDMIYVFLVNKSLPWVMNKGKVNVYRRDGPMYLQ